MHQQSLLGGFSFSDVLDHAKRRSAGGGPQGADRRTCTKSGLMVGLGETPQEVRQVMGDLRRVERQKHIHQAELYRAIQELQDEHEGTSRETKQ